VPGIKVAGQLPLVRTGQFVWDDSASGVKEKVLLSEVTGVPRGLQLELVEKLSELSWIVAE